MKTTPSMHRPTDNLFELTFLETICVFIIPLKWVILIKTCFFENDCFKYAFNPTYRIGLDKKISLKLRHIASRVLPRVQWSGVEHHIRK